MCYKLTSYNARYEKLARYNFRSHKPGQKLHNSPYHSTCKVNLILAIYKSF